MWFSANLVGIADMRNATEGVPYRFWPSSVGNGLRVIPLRGRGLKIRGEPDFSIRGVHPVALSHVNLVSLATVLQIPLGFC